MRRFGLETMVADGVIAEDLDLIRRADRVDDTIRIIPSSSAPDGRA